VISKVCDTGRHLKNSEGMACYGLAELIRITNR
jgi:hypothetical protein